MNKQVNEMTLLQLTKKRDDARKALSAASSPKARDKAMSELESATLALARFQSRLDAKTVKMVKKEERYEEEEEDEEEDEEESDDEPKKPASDDSDDDDDDDDDGDDDDDDSDDSEEDEDEDEDADEDEDEEEDEDEDEDEDARSKAIASARSVLRLAKKSGKQGAVASARSHLKDVKRAIRPKALGNFRNLKAACQRVTGKKSIASILGALEALAATAKSTEKLSADVSKLKADKLRSRVDAMLTDARRDGRVTKEQVKSLRAQGLRDPKWLKGYLDVLPKQVRRLEEGSIHGQTLSGKKDGEFTREDHLDAQNLTADERKIIETTAAGVGKSFDEFVAEMNKNRAKAGGRKL